MKARLILPALAVCICVLPGTTCPPPCEETDPNPAVDRIDLTLESRNGTTGDVRIEGVVENKGGGTFDSSAGQQSVQLYEVLGTAFNLKAMQEFEDLAPGATVTVSYLIEDWSTASEFPPDYRVIITYDPDIFDDANENNDDCTLLDNTLDKTASEINALFE
jgi:hypothetical protein